ncbi:MAG: ParB/RepB/Spo0J family partition protein [Pseudomonadota bacterium]|mgnify:FL=1|nr:ParB/RepB/Spo0J family partition protein [Pseudomonadota bacterium]
MAEQHTNASTSRLGRGLASLIGDVPRDVASSESDLELNVARLPIEKIQANKQNPRSIFSEDELVDLANSIREKGIVQPIIVREIDSAGSYEVIAGERRWRAAQIAQLDTIPAIIKTLSDDDALEIAIIENVQRSNLNPVDEAAGYQRLIDIYNYTQEDLAQVIGKSRSYIANILRLNNLPTKVKDYLSEGLLTIGHARALISLENAENLADMIVSKGLSVRQIEQLVKNPVGSQKKNKGSSIKDKNISALEQLMTDAIGLKVQIHAKDAKSGKVVVNYTSDQHLELIKNKLLG